MMVFCIAQRKVKENLKSKDISNSIEIKSEILYKFFQDLKLRNADCRKNFELDINGLCKDVKVKELLIGAGGDIRELFHSTNCISVALCCVLDFFESLKLTATNKNATKLLNSITKEIRGSLGVWNIKILNDVVILAIETLLNLGISRNYVKKFMLYIGLKPETFLCHTTDLLGRFNSISNTNNSSSDDGTETFHLIMLKKKKFHACHENSFSGTDCLFFCSTLLTLLKLFTKKSIYLVKSFCIRDDSYDSNNNNNNNNNDDNNNICRFNDFSILRESKSQSESNDENSENNNNNTNTPVISFSTLSQGTQHLDPYKKKTKKLKKNKFTHGTRRLNIGFTPRVRNNDDNNNRSNKNIKKRKHRGKKRHRVSD